MATAAIRHLTMTNCHLFNMCDMENNQGLPYVQMKVILEPNYVPSSLPIPHGDSPVHSSHAQMRTGNKTSLQRRLAKPNKIQLLPLHVISTIGTIFLFYPHNSTLYNP